MCLIQSAESLISTQAKRATPGMKAVGKAREHWKSLQARRGELIPIRLPSTPPNGRTEPEVAPDAGAGFKEGHDTTSDVDPDVAEVLRFLNDTQTRATYTAMAEFLGSTAQSISSLLGDRRIEASWVVNARTGMPTGYPPGKRHPDLTSSAEIVRSGEALNLRLSVWGLKQASTRAG